MKGAPIRVRPYSIAHFGSRQSWFPRHEASDVLCAWKVCEGNANARADMHLRVCRVTGDGLSQDSGSTYSGAPCDPRKPQVVEAQSEGSTKNPVTT